MKKPLIGIALTEMEAVALLLKPTLFEKSWGVSAKNFALIIDTNAKTVTLLDQISATRSSHIKSE